MKMDIRNFFGAKSVAKKPKEPTKEKASAEKKQPKPKPPVTRKDTCALKENGVKESNKAKDEDELLIIDENSYCDSVSSPKSETKTGKSKSKSNSCSKMKKDSEASGSGNKRKKSVEKSWKANKDLFDSGDSEDEEISTRRQKSKQKAKKVVAVSESDSDDDIKTSKKKGKKKQKAKKSQVIDSESEEDPIPKKRSRNKASTKKKITTYVSDSDDEKPKRNTVDTYFKPATPKQPSPKKSHSKKLTPDKGQLSVMDFFGGGEVKRSEKKTIGTEQKITVEEKKKGTKRKADATKARDSKNNGISDIHYEMEMHSDDDFAETLALIDEMEQKAKKAKTEPDEDIIPDTPPSKESTKKQPSESKSSPKKQPSESKSSPKKQPSESKSSPKKQPSESKSSPKKQPSESKSSPKKQPSESKSSPTKQPSESRSSPRKQISEFKPSPEKQSNLSKTPKKKSLETSYSSPSSSIPDKKTPQKSHLTPVRSSPRRPSRDSQSSRSSTPTLSQPIRSSPRRTPKTSDSSSSLSSKLSSKAKASKSLVVDTPKAKTPKKTPVKDINVQVLAEDTPVSKQKPDEGTPSSLQRGASYRSYLTREGPRSLGSKEVPEGGANCLEGLTFVITGVLESFERDDLKSIIERFGGKVTGNVSKKTTYVVAGRDAGTAKMSKAEQFKTEILDEDGVLDLIRSKPGKKSKYEIMAEKEVKASLNSAKSSPKISKFDSQSERLSQTSSKYDSQSERLTQATSSQDSQSSSRTVNSQEQSDQSGPTLLWVDKYKPTSLKSIIGQQGDKSNAKKLFNWLRDWHKYCGEGKAKTGPSKWGEDGRGYRAALLSGPPGIGKTTSATLVCQEAGFTYVELNASDTRSKKSLQSEVAEALNNHTLMDYFSTSGKVKSSHEIGSKHALLMDEVDGMAGNEDRGGMQELIGLIKSTKIPIICMCNDRQHPKIRSLVNYCFDLRFQRPRVEQIKAAMMTIAYREKLKIPPPAMNEVIEASNHDVRQVLHNLEMWSAKEKALSNEQIKSDAKKAQKDLKLGPFEVCRKVFSNQDHQSMSLNDKSDLFFHDYNIAPLFVQENYITANAFAARGDIKKQLDLLSKTADSIASGDLVDKKIRNEQAWSMLPLQAMFASVLPGEYMSGSCGQINFPSWLGKNSTKTKTNRILQELRTHMRLKVSCAKEGLSMEYLPHMKHRLTKPLIESETEGVREVIDMLDEYNMLKEDFDNIMDITLWSNEQNPMSKVATKVKSAFTRTYNKESHATPYSTEGAPVKKKRGGGANTDQLEGDEDVEGATQGEDEEEEVTADAFMKKNKPGGKTTKKSATTDKGKGKGKGKGKK
ncbi:unnamed protein product [Owenia fusiformis]|uniref:Replication factor C subunit 1 n=1 Tax=Owenia fusiformis TaxID=6347 RepID=A0A8S4MZR7_OWEFU|nr:unnamed protein product [Owenia fusiformis]